MSKRIFENIFVITYPVLKKQLRLPTSTWPPAVPRPCQVPPTQQPSDAPAKERAPMTGSASGGRGKALPGTDRSLPGMAGNRSKMEIPVCDTATRFVPTHLLLYRCIAVPRRTSWVGRLARRILSAIPSPLWHSAVLSAVVLL